MLTMYMDFTLFILAITTSNVMLENTSMFTSTTVTTTEAVNFNDLEPRVYCKFQPNGHDCGSDGLYLPKFYFDLQLEDCKTATVGRCPHNLNTFDTLRECHETCRDDGLHRLPGNLSVNVICRLQYDFGSCSGYNPQWYFDVTTRRCQGFSYSGCGGNLNRFATQQMCAVACNTAFI